MAKLIVRRDKGHADKLRKYRILLDGVEIGQLAEGAELHREISEGQHTLEAKIDWCGSQPLEFTVELNNQVLVACGTLRGWSILLVLYYVIFKSQKYLTLELLPPGRLPETQPN